LPNGEDGGSNGKDKRDEGILMGRGAGRDRMALPAEEIPLDWMKQIKKDGRKDEWGSEDANR
jgi:hypothetical protein